jgi:class 3 adenylate cyclase/predicted ATPase
MTFDELLAHVIELLQRQGRVSYGALKRRFELDEEYLQDLKDELIDAQQLALDEDGRILIWRGNLAKNGTKNGPTERSGLQAPVSTYAEAERRQLTVLFCDLVGSTALSEQLDPEELRDLLRAYQEACAVVTDRFEGSIAQYLGDGILIYFGYPTAHEDGAARAVYAGLGIIEAVRLLNPRLSQPIEVRIGIHTGLVVVGEMGGGSKRERLALGETPNIAARMQGLARPDSVVLSAATHRLVAGLFDCQDVGSHQLKGISAPIAAYHVRGESEVRSRFEVSMSKGLTPLVGREEEQRVLLECWEQAKVGTGRVALLSGEPGIGKSRLVQELKEYVSMEGAACIEFRCSPYHQNSAYYPLLTHLQRLLEFAKSDAPAARLTKLARALAHYRFPEADTLSLLADLLSLPQPDGALPLTLSPQKQKQKTQEALVAWIFEEAGRAAVNCVWEDLHWADPSTLEVLTLALDRVSASRLLVLLTFRPGFAPPWQIREYFNQLILTRLGRSEIESMVKQVTGRKAFPAEVLNQIVVKTDGVPLFVEELTKMVLESGLLQEGQDRYELAGPLPPLAIPATLQDSLMARLDRLAPVREIAQVGATLGREFSYELLHAVCPVDEERLRQGLQQLVEAELVYQQGVPPQAVYLYKHALIRDTAYQSLLKSRRRQYHQQIAQVLEERFPDTKETQPELVAYHYTEANLISEAIPYWQSAGQRAVQRSANPEAISHLTKGLELLETLPKTPEHVQQELILQLTLGTPLIASKGNASLEVEKAYTRARELCQQLGETPQLFPTLSGLWRFYFVRAELKVALELGEQLLRLAQSAQQSELLLAAHLALGYTLVTLGELAPAREHLQQGLVLYNPEQHRAHAHMYGQDPGMACLSHLAWALWMLGYPDQALNRSQAAITLARGLSHPHSLVFALYCAAALHQFRREAQATRDLADATITVSTEQGFAFFLATATVLQGWACAQQGQAEMAVTQMHRSLAGMRAMGAEFERPHFLALLAEAYEEMGQIDEGLNTLVEAIAAANKTEERLYEAELYRLKGQLTLQRKVHEPKSKAEEAEACFFKAIDIARKQQAKSFELRAAVSLACLWRSQGKREEARLLLSDIYGWFTEGFDTNDLQQAKALIED